MILDESLFEGTRGVKVGIKRGPYNTSKKTKSVKLDFDDIEKALRKGVGKNGTKYVVYPSTNPRYAIRIGATIIKGDETSKKQFITDASELKDAQEYFNNIGLDNKIDYSPTYRTYSLLAQLPRTNDAQDRDVSEKFVAKDPKGNEMSFEIKDDGTLIVYEGDKVVKQGKTNPEYARKAFSDLGFKEIVREGWKDIAKSDKQPYSHLNTPKEIDESAEYDETQPPKGTKYYIKVNTGAKNGGIGASYVYGKIKEFPDGTKIGIHKTPYDEKVATDIRTGMRIIGTHSPIHQGSELLEPKKKESELFDQAYELLKSINKDYYNSIPDIKTLVGEEDIDESKNSSLKGNSECQKRLFKENLSTEQELEQLPYVYQATEIEPNTYKLDTEWVKTEKQAHSIYLKIVKAAKEIFKDRYSSLIYVKNEWRDKQKEVHCVLRIKLKEEQPLKEDNRYASLSDRKSYRVFAPGDHVRYINNDGWTDGGKANIGRTGVILDSNYVGETETFHIKADDHREISGYADDSFLAHSNNLEFVESLKEDLSREDQQEYGLNTLINQLVKSEYDAIDEYNSAIVTLEAEGQGEYTDIIRSIIEDERHHIGNLQEIMNRITPGTEAEFEHGKEEAIETLDEEKPEEIKTTIDTEKGEIKTFKLDKVEKVEESLEDTWYALVNHSDMTDIDFALVSKDKEALLKHWDDLINITEGNIGDLGGEEYFKKVIAPKIEELDKINIYFIDSEGGNIAPNGDYINIDDNNNFLFGEKPLIILKQSHSRF